MDDAEDQGGDHEDDRDEESEADDYDPFPGLSDEDLAELEFVDEIDQSQTVRTSSRPGYFAQDAALLSDPENAEMVNTIKTIYLAPTGAEEHYRATGGSLFGVFQVAPEH